MVCEIWTSAGPNNLKDMVSTALAASEVENPDRTDITTAVVRDIPETMMLNGREVSFAALEAGGNAASRKPDAGINLKH